ncbi:cytochrome P450 18a1 [Arctopsyche grandis]|uniref:cytochrome P450 18a1 n=1 Tax=Arctopsyche grandis TaxID=121162 RepID=UPI00406D9E9B
MKGGAKHNQYLSLAAKYGPMFSARLGNQLTVVLSDYRIIRDAFRREEFTSRPDTPFMQTIEGFGIINSKGVLWKEQRKFLHDKLRQFGMTYMGNSRQKMEKRIMIEVNELLDMLNATNGQPVDISPMLAVSVSNVICNIMMSVRFSLNDPRFRHFTGLIEEGMRLFGELNTVDYIPTWQYLPGKLSAKNKITKNREDMFQFYQEVIDEHKATFDPNNIRDLIDTYLAEIQKAKEEGRDEQLFEGKDHEQQIKQIIGDLFSAGMETIKTTLLWMIVFMLRNPEAMKKVQEELDQVIGRERLPRIEDLHYLPVTETTILESLRRSSIVPLATTHTPTRDVTLNGYLLPAGCQVVPLINSVHMDPTLWDKPEQFRPERFMDASGNIRKPEYFMPFGVGRRMCLGDVLARMELFLFFANILHTFDISLPEGEPAPSLEGNAGVTISPDAFKIKLTPRPLATSQSCVLPTLLRNVGCH